MRILRLPRSIRQTALATTFVALTCVVAAPAGASPGPKPMVPVAIAAAGTAPDGLSPGLIRQAYGLPTRGAHSTIAVISPYDAPRAAEDLNAYDQRFGLPPCTVKNHCLMKLNQNGDIAPLPRPDPSGGMWTTESALGIEVTHGLCQSCRILLVEPSDETARSLTAAIQAGASAGASVVVTAYNLPETGDAPTYQSSFESVRVPIVTAAGDLGYSGSALFPASLPSVIAVGGTQLRFSPGGRIVGERAWSQTTSGCSSYFAVPPWQAGLATAAGCGNRRTVADISAVADPGAIVHVSGTSTPGGPWYVATGTSLSAPVIAATIGLAGAMSGETTSQFLYKRLHTEPTAFNDIRTGADADGCRTRICAALPGWDGPTGVGTPDGLAAFLPNGGVMSSRQPRLTIASPTRRQHIGRTGFLRVSLSNGNAFHVSGRLMVERIARSGRRVRREVLGRATFSASSLGITTVRIKLSRSGRLLVRRAGLFHADAELVVSGPAGGAIRLERRAATLIP